MLAGLSCFVRFIFWRGFRYRLITGSFRPEWPARMLRNGWLESIGTGGSNGADFTYVGTGIISYTVWDVVRIINGKNDYAKEIRVNDTIN